MGRRMRVGEWQMAGEGSARAAGGSFLGRRMALLTVLVVGLLALGCASADASGLSGATGLPPGAQAGALGLPRPAVSEAGATVGASTSAAATAHALDYSLTPSTTEPYLACGLPKRGHAACMSIIVPPGTAHRASSLSEFPGQVAGTIGPSYEGSGEGGGFSPSDLRSAYGISATGGSGQTVAIVDAYDDPNAETDLKTYRSHYGLSECTTANGCFRKVNQKGEAGNYPTAESEWAVEIALDVDMVSAICSECHILLVEATNSEVSNLLAAEDEAVTLGATEISNSWDSGEFSEETSDDTYFNHSGIPITVSSGDKGYGVSYPSASRYVISVGGTTLKKATSSRGWEETAWAGSGSGCSAYELKPAWQTGEGCVNRTDADVAAVANPESPVSLYDSYNHAGWLLVGGTSVGSPIVAGVESHASKTVREERAEAFYKHALFDVAAGANGYCRSYLCAAEEGYDGPTGWGTPDGPIEHPAGFRTVTSRATNLALTGATLNGYIDPEGKETTYQFEYGKTISYGSKAPAFPASVGSGVAWKAVSQHVVGLERETTYHYRLVATNNSGVLYGADRTVTTTAWATQTPQEPSGAEEPQLRAVSCSSVTSCITVGDYYSLALKEVVPLAEHWSGTEWQLQSTTEAAALYGVSCLSSTLCMTVGAGDNGFAFADRWNGTEWQTRTIPNPSEADFSTLRGVSCTSSIECAAVGWYNTSAKNYYPLAEQWNGTEWQVRSVPNPSGAEGSPLAGVSCPVSSFTCMAVGAYYNATTKREEVLAERWNGGQWLVQTTPDPTGSPESKLSGVACASSVACTAVGSYYNSAVKNYQTLAERWNGTEWLIQPTPNPPAAGASRLTSVSCPSATVCIATGQATGEAGFVERWNGSEWIIQSTPIATESLSFFRWEGVSCPSLMVCVAAGIGGKGSVIDREALPTATSEAASGVTFAQATLHGLVNAEESDAHYHFEYGTTSSYGTSTPEVDAGAGASGQGVSDTVSGLEGSTAYHFRLVVTNGAGKSYGEDETFTTKAAEWRLSGAVLTGPVATGWKGKLKLSDSSNGAVVECEDAAEGPVQPGVNGEVTKWTMSKCVGLKGCESSGVSVEPLGLTWLTALIKSSEGTIRDWIAGSGHEPGYLLKCKVLGISFTDECTRSLPIEMTMTNGSTGVTATFLTAPKLNCNGKSGVGSLEGTQTIEATKGGKLEVI